MTQPSPLPTAPPYASNEEYLAHGFSRLDLLLKAQTVRWRALLASTKPASHWGMALVSDAEVEAYLESSFLPPGRLPGGLEEQLAPYWRRAEERGREIEARLGATPPEVDLRLPRLAAAFGLDELERDLLLLLLLGETDERLRRLIGYLLDDATRRQPSVALAEQILWPVGGPGELAARLTDGPLTAWRLVICDGDDDPRADRLLRLDDRIAAFLAGSDAFDARLAGVVERPAAAPEPVAGSPDGARLDRLGARLGGLPRAGEDVGELRAWPAAEVSSGPGGDLPPSGGPRAGAVVLLHGPYGSGRRALAARLADAAGRPLLLARADAALARPAGWGETVDLAVREALLAGAALAFTGCERLLERPGDDALAWERLVAAVDRFAGLTLLLSERPWEPAGRLGDRLFIRFDLPPPTYAERRSLWRRALAAAAGPSAELPSGANPHASGSPDGAPAEPSADRYAGPFAERPTGVETSASGPPARPPGGSSAGGPAGSPAIAVPLEPGLDRELLAGELANGFQLTAGQVADALAAAAGEALKRDPENPRIGAADLFSGCRRQSGRTLSRFARRVEPRPGITFDQLVLPSANRRQLDDLRRRIRYRSRVTAELGFERRLPLGKGLVALFSGSSGTGKTLAAELLAGEQGVDLYKVDLAAVVSKYVGETEKNLAQVFSEAETSNALLFFDEADALFGKRGEVKEARDRWANLEINYLLQRIEEYPGVVVLTTNLRQNIDEAFLRRIQVIVEFPFPDVEARLAIWRGLFPDEVERPGDGELTGLAERFRLPGGSIKNVVLDAAHRALAENGSERPELTVRHLGLALAREYQKLGKPVTRTEFGDDLYSIYEAELA